MGFNGGFGFVPTFSGGGGGGSWPTTGPSTVRWGATLIVSSQGDDATGDREDVAFHYSTIEGAFAEAQAGDLILILPGTHSVNSPLIIDEDINFHLFPGASIQGPNSDSIFKIQEAITLRLTGNGNIVTGTGGAFIEQTASSSTVFVEFDTLRVATQSYGIYTLAGTLFVRSTGKILALGDEAKPIYINDENAQINAYLDLNFGGDEFTGTERQTNGFGLIYAGVANFDDSSVDLYFKTIRCNVNGPAVQYYAFRGRVYIMGDVIKNEADMSYAGDPVCCVYNMSGGHKKDFKLCADLVGSNFARGYVSIPGGEQGSPVGNGARVCILGNITTDERACVYVGGNSTDLYYADGYRLNKKLLGSQIESCVVLGNYDGGAAIQAGQYTFLQLSGTDKCLYQEAVIQLNNYVENPVVLRLKNQTTVGNDGETNFSVSSNTNEADVQVLSHYSNIPVNPDWITEVISNSIVDPLITQ